MKTFIVAGYDTTSSTLCLIFNLLHFHPEILEKVRQEHDAIFGTTGSLKDTVKSKPHLLNDLPYTTAVIKVGSVRTGSSQTPITHNGATYPTTDCMVWICSHTLHRRADLFPSPDDFIPPRFLPHPHNFQAIQKYLWRAFEKVSRGCIAQALAMLEMKIILVMVLWEFDVTPGYLEWDAMMGREKPGQMLGGRRVMVSCVSDHAVDGDAC